MRPGYLYFSIFIWLVLTGGRFTAPFLQNMASFDDAMIGITISIQLLTGSLLGSIGAVYSDKLELKYPNRGRLYCLGGAIIFGTLSFEIHAIVKLLVTMENKMASTAIHIAARVMYASSSAILFPVLDGITLSYLKKHNWDESAYGRERLFGAVAWALASMAMGPVLDAYGFGIFFGCAPLGGIFCLLVLGIYARRENVTQVGIEEHVATSWETEMVEQGETSHRPTEESPEELTMTTRTLEESTKAPEESSNNTFLLLKDLTSTCAACGFIASSFTLNMGTSVVENLIFLYFETLGGSNTACGLTVVVTVLFEIPIFHYAPQLLAYFGAETLQIIACLAYMTRVVGYTFVPQGRMILVVLLEPLHGVTYASTKTATVAFAARTSPSGYEASSQGLLSMILGMGSVVGVSFGGWIEECYGPKVLYRLYAGIVALGLVALLGSFRTCTFSPLPSSRRPTRRRCYKRHRSGRVAYHPVSHPQIEDGTS